MKDIRDNNIAEIIEYALAEYSQFVLSKTENNSGEQIVQEFGNLSVKIRPIIVMNNRLYIREYDISDNSKTVIRFILGNVSMLFGHSGMQFRTELLNSNTIKGVITLKQSFFNQLIIPAAIIVLDKNEEETWFCSANNMEQLCSLLTGIVPDDIRAYYSKDISPENLMPDYYNETNKEIQESFKGKQVKQLGDLATIIVGRAAKREEFSETGIPYLRARDIQKGHIVRPDSYINEEYTEHFSRQLIQEGDILLTKNFGQNKLALVTEGDLPAIASNLLFIIRPAEVSEGYLYKYLTSETGNSIFNKQLNRIQRGVTVPSITLRDLCEVEVPVFDQEIMDTIEAPELHSDSDLKKTATALFSNAESISKDSLINGFIESGWDSNRFNCINNKDSEKAVILSYTIDDNSEVMIVAANELGLLSSVLKYYIALLEKRGHTNKFFYILTNGIYYEIHALGIKKALKLLRTPTIDELVNWEREER